MSRPPAGRATAAMRRSGRTVGAERGDGSASNGGKIEIERPRVRGVDGREVTIPSWETSAQEDWLGRWAMNLMLINVPTRRFDRAVRLPVVTCRHRPDREFRSRRPRGRS